METSHDVATAFCSFAALCGATSAYAQGEAYAFGKEIAECMGIEDGCPEPVLDIEPAEPGPDDDWEWDVEDEPEAETVATEEDNGGSGTDLEGPDQEGLSTDEIGSAEDHAEVDAPEAVAEADAPPEA